MSYMTKLLQIVLVTVCLLLPQHVYSQGKYLRFFVEEVSVKPSNMGEYYKSIPKVQLYT